MDVLSALVAHLQPTVAVHPRESSFHNPPVSTQLLAGFDAPPGDARRYAPLPQGLPASREVVALVSVQLLRALAWSAARRLADRRDGLYRFLQDLGVVDVRGRVDHTERDAFSVDHNMALRALISFIRRILTGLFALRGRVHLPSPIMPSANLSGRLLLNGPGASDSAAPTPPPRSIL